MVGEGGAAGDGRGNAVLQKTIGVYYTLRTAVNLRLIFLGMSGTPSPTTSRQIASVSVGLPSGEGGPRPVGSYFRPKGGTSFCAKGANIIFVCGRKMMLPYGK